FMTRSASGMKMSMGQYGRRFGRRFLGLAFGGAAVAAGGTAFAAGELGQPHAWGFDLQQGVTPVMESVTSMHNGLLVVITLITLFVTALLVIAMVRFNARSNPVPSKTTHNTLIEVAWTIIPVLILVGIAVPSFRLLFEQLDLPKADLTVKATGKQWYWTYTYPDNGKFEFDSLLAQDKKPRLLAVDNELVVPVNKVVRVQVIGADVIHSFGVPSFGMKVDAIPGRLNETWFKATKTGIFYGQCSELCGRDHAFMPIAVRVVSEQEFAAWVETAKKKFASNPANAVASAAGVVQ
ncbi:MAG TPA: cytochrome c oxidase subunit II, partial [Luteimonas sp.]|nr:cytochrome c oxidase subunit II [Luteimonas sp.]